MERSGADRKKGEGSQERQGMVTARPPGQQPQLSSLAPGLARAGDWQLVNDLVLP